MNEDLIKYYELLGVSPGVSTVELKTAHRDLAKVWHPDRFAHDPRLQQKAQEKLKEINEAYDQLTSAKTGRRKPVSTPAASAKQTSAPAQPHARPVPWTMILMPVLVLALLFFVAYKILIPASEQPNESTTRVAEQPQALPGQSVQQADAVNKPRVIESPRGKRVEETAAVEKESRITSVVSEQEARQKAPLPTVTVTIDPVSGMLAKSDCPTKSRMTYPQGSEPGQYCNVSHRGAAPEPNTEEARPKESRLKSFARRLGAPAKLLGDKETTTRNP